MKLNFAGINIAQNYWQAGAIIFLIFILVLVMAYMSRSFMSWSLSGAWIGLVIGFILALVLEGFLIVGGKTVVTTLLGWKNAPKPIQTVLDEGHAKLLDTLGVPASCSGTLKM